MAIIRKYNQTNQQWEPVASGDATGVFTDNPLLTSGKLASIEDVLVRDRGDIELLKKNVSWLAEHGGGGGYGPGGGSASFSVEILDPSNQTTPISEVIWSSNIQQMYYQILSNGSSKYTVQIQVDGKTVATSSDIRKGSVQSISRSTLNITKDAVLQVIAYDESETSERAICSIKVAQVRINYTSMQCNIRQLQESNNFLDISYYTSIQGDYTLYWSENPINVKDGIVDVDTDMYKPIVLQNVPAGNSVYSANIVTELGIPQQSQAGQYVRYLLLMKTDNNTVYSVSQAVVINIVVTTGILVSPLVISSAESPIIIARNQLYNLSFIVYSGQSTTNTFSYRILNGDNSISGNWIANNLFGRTLSFQINPEAQGLDVNDDDNPVTELRIEASSGQIKDYTPVWFKITQPSSEFLRAYESLINNRLIFDYTFRNIAVSSSTEFESINEHYHPSTYLNDTTVSSKLSLYNIGTDSGINEGTYRMRHLAHGKIETNSAGIDHIFPSGTDDTNALIMGNSNAYSVEIAYTLGKEISDNIVIFKLGDYDPIHNQDGHGIVVRSHDYHVALGGTIFSGDLQDDKFTQLDFIYFQTSAGKRFVYVYLDGKMLKAVSAGETPKFDMAGSRVAYLAYDGSEDNLLETYANVDIHSCRLYEGALNAGQITCSYINNYVSANRIDGLPNYDLLDSLRVNNGFNKDADVADGAKICNIYDVENGTGYSTTDYTWNITAGGDGAVAIPDTIQKLPIPKVVLTVGWSYNNFTSGSNLVPQNGCTFQYYDYDTETNTPVTTPVTGLVTVEPQGTTSSLYEIKNINITYENGLLFSPKKDWFPESQHTLKADVSDSGHLNNAVIGKFINDCFNNRTDLVEVNNVFPTRGLIENYKSQNQLPSSLTMKITVEGFPVLLIVRFLNADNTYDPRILGIYSFNLGRGAYYNQGYIVPKHLYDVNGGQLTTSAIMPGFFGTPPASDLDTTYTAYCFEGQESIDTTSTQVDLNSTYTYAVINSDNGERFRFSVVNSDNGFVRVGRGSRLLDSDGNPIPYDSDHVTKYQVNPDGYFWSPDATYASNLFSIVYGENSSEALNDFRSLTEYVARYFNYEKAGFDQVWGTSGVPIYYIDSSGGDAKVRHVLEGQTFTPNRLSDTKVDLPISLRNIAFYYVVAMFFGLVDNFGKNMQFKKWVRRSGTSNTMWTPAFYDLDTALKLSNTGDETVSSTVFDCSIVNDPDGRMEFVYGKAEQSDDTVITVAGNKLFGFDNAQFSDAYSTGFEDQYTEFSIMWNYLRKTVITDIDEIMDTYFNTQLSRCGELILNYDYYVKYLNTSQVAFLHGDRLGTIRNWLNERIVFLDSVFGYTGRSDSTLTNSYLNDHIYNTPWINKVNLAHNSGVMKLTVTTNKPLIMWSRIGGNASYYTYIKKNVPTQIHVANSLNTPNIQTQINNSDCIIDIDGLRGLKLTSITPVTLGSVMNPNGTVAYESNRQYGTLSGLQRFDLNNVTTLVQGIDFSTLFNTWDTTALGKEPTPFGLRSIVLRNTKFDSASKEKLNVSFELTADSHYLNIDPFQNIIEVDVRNSATSTVNLPKDVSLRALYIANSSVETVTLNQQPMITSLDFTGCSRLTTVQLTDMPSIESITFDSSNTNLENLTISGLPKLKTINIQANGMYTKSPKISISNCGALTSIVINRWTPSGVEPTPAYNYLNISDTPMLTTLSLRECKISKVICKDISNLNTIDLTSSYISILSADENADCIDLSQCKRDVNLAMQACNYIEKISFGETEFNVNYSGMFRDCKELKTITGKLVINSQYTFTGCSKLANLKTLSSLQLVNPNVSMVFDSTACEVEDVKWVFMTEGCIGPNVANISWLFAECPNIKWTDEIPADLFKYCGNIINASYLFYNTGSSGSYYKVPSPTLNNEQYSGGLFTPLVNCENAAYLLSGQYVVDRFVFAHSRKTNKLSSINGFNPVLIVDDVNTFEVPNAISVILDSASYLDKHGNINGMFSYLAEMPVGFNETMRTTYINYDRLENLGLRVSSGCSILGSFRASYAKGDFNLSKIFADDTEKAKVKGFYQSFTVASAQYAGGASFKVDGDTFAGFTNLEDIGYTVDGIAGTRTSAAYGTNTAFGGDGMIKTADEFPYTLLQPCKKLKMFAGFFYKFKVNTTSTIEIPHTLFDNLQNLQNVCYCFYDFQNTYKLTGGGFSDCSNLANVAFMFAASSHANSRLTGSIPYKLFYHGMNNDVITVQGVSKDEGTKQREISRTSGQTAIYETTENGNTVEYRYQNFDVVDKNYIEINPTTKITKATTVTDDEGVSTTTTETITESWDMKTFTYQSRMPKATIIDMSSCFMYANTDPYSMNANEIETLTYTTYNPFDYVYSRGQWLSTNPDLVMYSKTWAYDGVYSNLNFVEAGDVQVNGGYTAQYERVDDLREFVPLYNAITTMWSSAGSETVRDINPQGYIAAPDLLLYCKSDCSVVRLFQHGGPNIAMLGWMSSWPDVSGVKGRLCPYMLRPIPDTVDFSHMFENCKLINGIQEVEEVDGEVKTGNIWFIPESFFKHISQTKLNVTLEYMFAGVKVPHGTYLNVFDTANQKRTLNIAYLFYRWGLYTPSNSKIEESSFDNVFTSSNIYIGTLHSAFAVDPYGSHNEPGDGRSKAVPNGFKVTFESMFREYSKVSDLSDRYVFFGYLPTTNFVTKTLRTDDNTYHNYTTMN